MEIRKLTMNFQRARRSARLQSSSQPASGRASCGLMVARAMRSPAIAGIPDTRAATAAVTRAATSSVSCWSLMPCTTPKLPSVRSTMIVFVPADERQLRIRSQSKTTRTVRAARAAVKTFCTSGNGNFTMGARRKAT